MSRSGDDIVGSIYCAAAADDDVGNREKESVGIRRDSEASVSRNLL